MYGDSEYAKGCLLARRLIERGVRTVQISHSIDGYDIAWDTGHGNIVDGHRKLAVACDQGTRTRHAVIPCAIESQ